RVHRQLGSVRLPTKGRLDLRQLVVGEPELPVERLFLRTHTVTPAIAVCSSDAKSGWPPVGPTSGSTACSGCGISPTTLPAGLRMPATLFVAPFGLWASSTIPVRDVYRKTTSPSRSTSPSCSGVATHWPSPCL